MTSKRHNIIILILITAIYITGCRSIAQSTSNMSVLPFHFKPSQQVDRTPIYFKINSDNFSPDDTRQNLIQRFFQRVFKDSFLLNTHPRLSNHLSGSTKFRLENEGWEYWEINYSIRFQEPFSDPNSKDFVYFLELTSIHGPQTLRELDHYAHLSEIAWAHAFERLQNTATQITQDQNSDYFGKILLY